jgi:hypothetical protein
MFTLSDTLGQVSGEGEKLGMVCLSRVAPEDGLGALPHGLPAGQCFPIALAMRRARKQFIRLNDPWAGDPDGEPPARPGEPKPAAERPSIGAARPREATGHRRSAVLPFAAHAAIWAAGGRRGREGPRRPCVQVVPLCALPSWGSHRASTFVHSEGRGPRLVPPRWWPGRAQSLPHMEDEHDRALSLRTALVRDLERAPFRMGVRPSSPWDPPGL